MWQVPYKDEPQVMFRLNASSSPSRLTPVTEPLLSVGKRGRLFCVALINASSAEIPARPAGSERL